MYRLAILLLCVFSAVGASERLYFDMKAVPLDQDGFFIHIGENNWLETNEIHKDASGFFTYTSSVSLMSGSQEYRRRWQCPYCHRHWDMGQPCQNPDCPSKYKS